MRMAWLAQLDLQYTVRAARTCVHFRHDGPLRVLRSLYPEGDAVCHNVLVHPPGGLVGGDTLDIRVQVAPGAHAPGHHTGSHAFLQNQWRPATQRTH